MLYLRNQDGLSIAVRRLVAQRITRAKATSTSDRRGPSSVAMRRELEAFRRAQGAAYWHHDRRA